MKKIASPLFQDLSEAELDTLAAARHLRTRQFAKHEVIFRAGSACGRSALCCVVPCTLKIWISGAPKAS